MVPKLQTFCSPIHDWELICVNVVQQFTLTLQKENLGLGLMCQKGFEDIVENVIHGRHI